MRLAWVGITVTHQMAEEEKEETITKEMLEALLLADQLLHLVTISTRHHLQLISLLSRQKLV